MKNGLFETVSARFAVGEIPALTEQYRVWLEKKPLAGCRILDAAPVFFNTCVKYAVLIAAGADLTVTYSPRLPWDQDAVRFLEQHQVNVIPEIREGVFDVILDCGALHRHIACNYGAVELTRSGVDPWTADGRNVFLADSGALKHFETCLGTGESCLRALRHLGYGPFNGSRVLLFGHGKVGQGIHMYFCRAGAVVTVVDAQNCMDETFVRSAIAEADFIITATGVAQAHIRYADALTASGAVLGNMGVDDEFGDAVPADRVLNRKKTLNFLLEEPTLTRYIDPVLALHNAGAEILLKTQPGTGAFVPGKEIEREIVSAVKRAGVITADELEMIRL